MTTSVVRTGVAAAFALSALLKGIDFHATAALMASTFPALPPVGARALLAALVLVELTAAGALALGAGPQRLVCGGVLALLAAFTAAAGAMALAGAESCGCFGTRFEMGPGATIAKNAVLMAMVGLLLHRAGEPRGAPGRSDGATAPSDRCTTGARGVASHCAEGS